MGDPIHDVAAEPQRPQPGSEPYISPKIKWPTVALAALGIAVLVLDQVGVIDVDDSLWITLLGSSVGVGGVGFAVDDPADTR